MTGNLAWFECLSSAKYTSHIVATATISFYDIFVLNRHGKDDILI